MPLSERNFSSMEYARPRGRRSGLRRAMKSSRRMNMLVSMRPGTTPAINSLPVDVSVMMA